MAIAGVTAFQWIMAAIAVASAVYQRQRQAKLEAAQKEAADKQKGFQLVSEGESAPLNVFYGRNKAGGTRVYHRVSGNYYYTPAGTNGQVFTSKGDTRSASSTVTETYINKISMYIPAGTDSAGQAAISIIKDVGITANVTINELSFIMPDRSFDSIINATQTNAHGYITLTHPPLVTANVFRSIAASIAASPVNYKIRGYDTVSRTIYLTLPTSILNANSSGMASSVTGTKNEFMFIQQVIGYKGISKVYCVDINDSDYRSDSFGDSSRMHVYTDGGIADPMMTANDDARSTSVFSNAAYASMVFRLNRDTPQFSGIPNVQFYLEGQKVYDIVQSSGANGNTYALSSTKTYSNSPPRCLLDYLTNKDYGKGLDISKIDLESFYSAGRICDIVVPTDNTVVASLGKLWAEKIKTTAKTIKLYECNMGVDTSKTIRDNIDTMLETMGRAELVWSGGKYKLQLEYPMEFGAAHIETKSYTGLPDARTLVYGAGAYQTNDVVQYPPGASLAVDLYRSTIDNNLSTPGNSPTWVTDVVSAYIDDSEIIHEENITQAWPSSQNKLNYYTVKFLNEEKDFAEDSVSWPDKYNGNVYSTYLAEDNGLELEGETFQTGDVTYYNALATAEEKVRSSRSQTVYKLGIGIQYSGLEPGDFIKVTSEILNIPGELLLIEEITVNDNNTAVVQAVKYDARNLAWNAKDTEVVEQRNIYNTDIGQASNLQFSSTPIVNGFSSGVISWSAAVDTRVHRYSVKITELSISQVDETTVWSELGTTDGTSLDIPILKAGSYTIAVVSVSSSGVQAPFYNIKTGSRWPMISAAATISALGVSIAPLSIYKRSNVPLTAAPINSVAPYGGTYDFLTSAQTQVPEGWSVTIPAGGSALYISQTRAKVTYPATVDSELIWNVPILFMQNGSSNKTLTAYTRGLPTSAPTGGSFTFPSGTSLAPLGVPPTGGGSGITWSMTPPEGTTALYSSLALATLPGTEGQNTNTLEWSVPSVIVTPGNQVADVYLYKWSTAAETGPTAGKSTYTWFDGSQVITEALNQGWSLDIPANNGTALLQLFRVAKHIVAGAGTSTSIVDWSTGYTIAAIGQNGSSGADGLKIGTAVVYQWALSTPTITGSTTYTWATHAIAALPNGWLASPGESQLGYTLYSATVNLSAASSATTSTVNWVTAGIQAIGYIGINGSSARTCYSITTLSTLASTPAKVETTGSDTFPPNDTWGAGTVWTANTTVPTEGQSLFQSDGIFDPSTKKTTWTAPYLSTFKVGSLSAINTNTGTLNVSGAISSANGNFRVDQLGSVTMKSVAIYNGANLILAAGANGIDYSKILGDTKPANNATVGAAFGVNISGQITSGTASTYIANAAIGNAQIGGDIYSDNWQYGVSGWYLQRNGNLYANNGEFRGQLVAASGTFAGSLQAATGTFSGNLSAASGTFRGNLDAAGGTFNGTLNGTDGVFSGRLSAAEVVVTDNIQANGISSIDLWDVITNGSTVAFVVSRTSKVIINADLYQNGGGGQVRLDLFDAANNRIALMSNPWVVSGNTFLSPKGVFNAQLGPGAYYLTAVGPGQSPTKVSVLKVMR